MSGNLDEGRGASAEDGGALPGSTRPDAEASRAALRAALSRYWRTNLLIMGTLLLVWAAVGLGCGVLFADVLDSYRLGGYSLGFWFAQQGSILVFVLLILVYAVLLNRLDRRHHAEIEALRGELAPSSPGSPSSPGAARDGGARGAGGERGPTERPKP